MYSSLKLGIQYVPPGSLAENPRNARTHSKQQIRQIAESIKAFGFTNPILIDADGMVLAGHGRLAGAKLLRMTEVPVLRIEHLGPDELRAYVIADNVLATKAGWSDELLAIELQHLLKLDTFDVTVTGFEVAEIDRLLLDAASADTEEALANLSATTPAVTQVGDLWLLGPHRVLCASALDESSYQTLIDARRVKLVFTDPPYGVPIQGHVSGKGAIKHREFVMGSGEMNAEQRLAFLKSTFALLAKYTTPGSVHFICIDFRHIRELLAAGEPVYNAPLNMCVYVKDNGGMGSLYRSRHELIFVFKNGRKPHRNNVLLGKYGRNRTNVWEYPGISTLSKKSEEGNLLALHPTVKPVALVADAILDCSARKDIVLDCFLGSGTTLIAAERTGRVAFGIELDPLYVDTAIRRWQRYTGGVAVHALSGKRFDEVSSINEVRRA